MYIHILDQHIWQHTNYFVYKYDIAYGVRGNSN